jgi:hypothetical protein
MQYRATGLVLALVTGGVGCGENVLVSSWDDLRFTAQDAGAEVDPADSQTLDGGRLPYNPAAAQRARDQAHKDKDRNHSSDDKSSH